MCKMTKLGQVGFLLLSIFAIKPAYCVRAKVVKPSSKKTMVERALLYDTNGNPISDDTVRSLTTIESEALASLARTEGYEGVARIFKNITMDYSTTASGYAARALAANLRTLEYKDDSSDAAAQAYQSMLDAASYETLAGISSVDSASYETASLVSKIDAASYETLAGVSSVNAASYETASLNSMNNGASYETASLNSMNNGASYETASLVSKIDAASYETLAGVSSVNAASYETASLNSMNNSASYETASLVSKIDAASYETASLVSKNGAASYETLAGVSSVRAASYETDAGISALGASGSLYSVSGAVYNTLLAVESLATGVAITYAVANDSARGAASYETAAGLSAVHAASYETLAGISSVDAASYAALASESSSDAIYQAGLVETSAADAASYEALALSSLITITGYQADVFNAVTAAENAINLASATMLYAADTAIFNVISLNAAPLIVLKAGARAIESIGTSISNLANNGITTQQNLVLATSVISDASLGLTALAAATNANASTISAAIDAESALAVALYDITGAANADSVCLMSVANSLGSLSDSMFDLVMAEVNDAISLKDIADGYSLLALAMQNLGSNSNAGADACETLIAYAYEIAIMSKNGILQNEGANATLLAPVATLSSQVALAMQAVSLNQQFAQAANFVDLRNCLLRTLKSAMATLNVAANSSLLVNQSDINTIGDSALASRNVIDLLVAAWEFGVGDAYENAGIVTQDGLVTTALANFSADGGATIDNLKALSSALVEYAEVLGVAVEIV